MAVNIIMKLYFTLTSILFLTFGIKSLSQAQSTSNSNTEAQKTVHDDACPTLIHLDLPEATPIILLNEKYWRTRWAQQFDLNKPLLDAHNIRAHSEALHEHASQKIRAQVDLRIPLDLVKLNKSLQGRLQYMLNFFNEGTYIKRGLGDLDLKERALFNQTASSVKEAQLHVALEPLQILCGPLIGEIEKPEADRTIDRNACTQIRPQALVQVIGSWSDELLLVRTRLALGWLPKSAHLLHFLVFQACERSILQSLPTCNHVRIEIRQSLAKRLRMCRKGWKHCCRASW